MKFPRATHRIFCFQHEEEARKFYQALIERLRKFNLEIAEEKTKITHFGRQAMRKYQKQNGSKPETFDFLGFTHYCGTSRRGNFRVKRKTSRKKYRASLLKCKEWVRQNRNMPAKDLMKKMWKKLQGYFRYYGITDNSHMPDKFLEEAKKILFKWLNRRSQRKSFDWDKFELFLKLYPLPKPKIYVNIYKLRPDIGYIK